MKHRFHKITALLLVAAMLVAFLAACGEEKVDLQGVYKFSESAVTLNAGENYALLIYDDTYSDRSYTATWSSDNPAVVSVEQSGFITALSAGSANVTADLHFEKENQDVKLTCAITVLETDIAVTGISINAMEQTLDVGGVTVLTATILPADATNKTVNWISSNPAVAIVSSGVVTAVGEGTAIVSAVTEDGSKTADCIITVNTPVDTFESLTFNKSSLSVAVGKTSSIVATVKPEGVAANIIWTSADETIATVVNGTVTGLKAGTTTVTATLNDKVTNKVATCKVTVTSSSSSSSSSSGNSSSGNSSSGSSSSTTPAPTTVKATSVKFDAQSMTVYVGQKGPWKFNPTVTPANTTEKGTWTSNNPSVAAVDSNGNITIGDIGSDYFAMATITYTVGSKSASGVVVVMSASSNPNPENNDTQTPSTETPENPQTGTETPSETPEQQQPAQTTGKVITSLILAEDDATINVGQAYAIEFDAYPKDAAKEETYTWTSSNESVATVTPSGVVTGLAVGETTITVKGTKSGISQSCKVTVKLKEIESITLSHATATLPLGQTTTLTATVSPSDASDPIVWTSQYPEIVSVTPLSDNRTALIASLASGTVVITASSASGKVVAQCTVASGITGYDPGTVTPGGTMTGSKIKVSVVVTASGDLVQGNSYSAYLTFSPALSAAQQQTLMYAISTNNNNVSVTRASANDFTKNSFTITPTVPTGSATLTGFVNSSDPSLQFEYEPKTLSILSPSMDVKTPIKSLTMSPTSLSLYMGGSQIIAVAPQPAANDDNITWFSSDESVVKVTGNGNTATVLAVGSGRAIVTAKTQGNLVTNKITATCTVIVNSTGSVDTTRQVIGVMQGSTYTPTNADIGASGTFVTGLAPTWTPGNVLSANSGSVDNSYVMSIDANGLITVGDNVAIGTTLNTSVRYAIAGANSIVQKDFTIMVVNSKQTSTSTTATVRLNATIGETGNLREAYGGATYTSNNPGVVYINSDGQWQADKAGNAEIRIKDDKGTDILLVIFTVGNPVKTVTMNVEESKVISEILGTTSQVTGATSNYTSRVSVSNLNNQFIITALSTGTARITVNLQDGSSYYIDVTVQSGSSSTGSGSSSSTSASLRASTTNVKGGNGLTVTLNNALATSTYNWSITSETGETIATFDNGSTAYETMTFSNTSTSVTVQTAAVTANTKITVHVSRLGIEVASITITVSK